MRWAHSESGCGMMIRACVTFSCVQTLIVMVSALSNGQSDGEECIGNIECKLSQACHIQCYDPCKYVSCKGGAQCVVEDHKASCTDPTDPPTKPECKENSDCKFNQACINNDCIDPCLLFKCNGKEKCEVKDHAASCIETVDCITDSKCASNQACISNKCVDPCQNVRCSTTECEVKEHIAICGTEEGKCKESSDCKSNHACINNDCIDPCLIFKCNGNKKCKVKDHAASCSEKVDCLTDSNCKSNQACISNDCVDPCNGVKCSDDVECEVKDHIATCGSGEAECKEDTDCKSNQACNSDNCVDPCYNVKCSDDVECEVNEHVATCGSKEAECKDDSDCESDQACNSDNCIDPCKNVKCKEDVECEVNEHIATCGSEEAECEEDSDCESDQACNSNSCIDPCYNVKCKDGTACEVKDHSASCISIKGSINRGIDCQEDIDCLPTQVCASQKCIDPCEHVKCGSDSTCKVKNHLFNPDAATGANHCAKKQGWQCKLDGSPRVITWNSTGIPEDCKAVTSGCCSPLVCKVVNDEIIKKEGIGRCEPESSNLKDPNSWTKIDYNFDCDTKDILGPIIRGGTGDPQTSPAVPCAKKAGWYCRVGGESHMDCRGEKGTITTDGCCSPLVCKVKNKKFKTGRCEPKSHLGTDQWSQKLGCHDIDNGSEITGEP